MYARQYDNDEQYPDTERLFIVEKIEWLTLNAAAELEECPVTGKTLREMIQRGDVPEVHWMQSPYGDGVIYLIDKAVLPHLPYRRSGQRGKNKDKSES
jgi:hypothetical protein